MKVSLRSLARAVAETARGMPESDWPALAEAAASLLIAQGHSKDAHTLARLVEREVLKMSGTLSVRITTRSGSDATLVHTVERVVRETLLRPCVIEERAEPSILGGALIEIGDERYDATLRGALTDLTFRLTAPLPTA